MMSYLETGKLGFLLIATALLVAIMTGVAQEPMENLRIPVEHYPSGKLKTELYAARAEVPPDGTIIAYGLVLKSFSEDGSLEIEITAEDCICDRIQQVASSSNHVSLTHGELTVNGDGFRWEGASEKFTVLRNARVVFPSAIVKEKRILSHVRK